MAGAVTIASMTVQKYGTQTSYPFAKDLRFDINVKNIDWSYVWIVFAPHIKHSRGLPIHGIADPTNRNDHR